MKNYYRKLFEPVDNAPLIVFRIFFGLLLAAETFGAILTGWVKKVLVDPQFTFSHIGMEWLQPLPGNGIYWYFAAMGVCGLLVMVGYKYRWSLGLFTILWAGAYFMQKTSYNNHYYLLMLVCLIMLFLPAHASATIDQAKNPRLKSDVMPQWCSWVMILQVAIVYFFATLAKFYPGWLDGTFSRILFQNSEFTGLQFVLDHHWFHLFIAYSGIAFDLLIIPCLLWKKTRTYAFFAAIFFHLFNAIFLQIGIFPFFALSFTVFFYPAAKIRRWFFPKKMEVTNVFLPQSSQGKKILVYFFVPYFMIQLALPMRHWFIRGDVLWTEEGHRLSWRMMLRQRQGIAHFKVIDKKTGAEIPYNYRSELDPKQKNFVSSHPDGIWQMAQRIRRKFAEQGKDVSVFADAKASVNDGPYRQLIDPETDLAAAEWDYFFHNDWILLYDPDGNPKK